MLHLIERLLPASLHRAGLRLAYRLRHQWRRWRKAPLAGCVVIVTDLKGQILMVRHSYGPSVWTLPGGGIKRGEDASIAASRELAEELGLTGGKLAPIGELNDSISDSPHTTYLFELRTDQMPKPDNREVIEARFFPPHSMPQPVGGPARMQLDYWREHCKRSN